MEAGALDVVHHVQGTITHAGKNCSTGPSGHRGACGARAKGSVGVGCDTSSPGRTVGHYQRVDLPGVGRLQAEQAVEEGKQGARMVTAIQTHPQAPGYTAKTDH
jgi:hypothetical protein